MRSERNSARGKAGGGGGTGAGACAKGRRVRGRRAMCSASSDPAGDAPRAPRWLRPSPAQPSSRVAGYKVVAVSTSQRHTYRELPPAFPRARDSSSTSASSKSSSSSPPALPTTSSGDSLPFSIHLCIVAPCFASSRLSFLYSLPW